MQRAYVNQTLQTIVYKSKIHSQNFKFALAAKESGVEGFVVHTCDRTSPPADK